MKKNTFILSIFLLLLTVAATPGSAQEIALQINGTVVQPAVAPILSEGTTLVPIRLVSQNLSAEITYDAADQSITIVKDGKVLGLKIGSVATTINGIPDEPLLFAPQIAEAGTAMVPIRFVSEYLDCRVNWEQATRCVTITTQDYLDQTQKNLALEQSGAAENAVLRLVNLERQKNGLSELQTSKALTAAARIRAEEAEQKFSHTRPDGKACFTVLAEQDIKYTMAGENIALNIADSEQVVAAWMNSPGHRENILNPQFTHLGIGFYQAADETYSWAQLFIKQ